MFPEKFGTMLTAMFSRDYATAFYTASLIGELNQESLKNESGGKIPGFLLPETQTQAADSPKINAEHPSQFKTENKSASKIAKNVKRVTEKNQQIPANSTNSKPKATSSALHHTNFSIDEILRSPSQESSKNSDNELEQGNDDEMDAETDNPNETDNWQDNESNQESDNQSARFSWLQCTRYKPPKLPRLKRKDGVKKRKLGRNPRVPFTQHQVNTLEDKFRRTHYLSSVDVAELSAALNLTETRVKIWFQNRRARERRDRESLAQNADGTSSSPVSNQSAISPQLPTSSTAFPWLGPVPPKPNTLAQFSQAIHLGTSAFTPVSFPGLPAPLGYATPTFHPGHMLPWLHKE